MSGRILVQMQNPVTQKPEAVEALAAYLNKPIEAGVLDLGSAKLVKSNKGDAFYTVTAKACSCPAAIYHSGMACKHQRKYFPQPKKSREELEAEGEAILEAYHNTAKRLARPPEESSIRDSLPGWPGGHNGPVEA
ncbi:MAG: hypothetical protein QM438_10365 [Euryarchaeota archaeon]|nr:hypothetical protein [Euryarchaeota archaeon]